MSWLAPLITVCLFVGATVVWRRQLVAKRRFEVAEQALTAFAKASDSLSRLRSPFMWEGELEAAHLPDGVPDRDRRRIRTFNAYVERAKSTESAYADLRAAQIVASVHLGQVPDHCISTLFKARLKVQTAIQALYGSPYYEGSDPSIENDIAEHSKAMRDILYERRSYISDRDSDPLTREIDTARDVLDDACRPYLRDPSWREGFGLWPTAANANKSLDSR